MMEPEDRIDALRSEWADNIPSDTRAQLMRQAEEATLATRASLNVENYIGSGLDRTAALNKADEIADDKLRLETRSRLNTEYDRQERNKQLVQKESYEQAARMIDGLEGDEKVGYEELPEEMLANLSYAQRNNLRKISENRFNPREKSDPDFVLELSMAYASAKSSGDWSEYNQMIKEESHKLTAEDRNKFVIKAFGDQLPEEVDSGLTDVQALGGALASANINDKNAKSVMLTELGRWRIRETERTGKAPTDKDRDAFIDYMLLQRDTNWLWGVGGGPMYERPAAEQAEILRTEDPSGYETIRKYLENRGITPTEQQIIDVYARTGRSYQLQGE
jgi:hypothetical protein